MGDVEMSLLKASALLIEVRLNFWGNETKVNNLTNEIIILEGEAKDAASLAATACEDEIESQAIVNVPTPDHPGQPAPPVFPEKEEPGERVGGQLPLPGFPIDENSSVEVDQNFNISGVDFFSTNPSGESGSFSGTYKGNFTVTSDPNLLEPGINLVGGNPYNLAVTIASVTIRGKAPFVMVTGSLNADRKSFSNLTGANGQSSVASEGKFMGSGGSGSKLEFNYSLTDSDGGTVKYKYEGKQ